jgi:adenylate cyclase
MFLGGEVHRYVGDALIATWQVGAPEDNARSIQCQIACQDAMAAVRPYVLHRYGVVPDFRAGLHLGPLVSRGRSAASSARSLTSATR